MHALLNFPRKNFLKKHFKIREIYKSYYARKLYFKGVFLMLFKTDRIIVAMRRTKVKDEELTYRIISDMINKSGGWIERIHFNLNSSKDECQVYAMAKVFSSKTKEFLHSLQQYKNYWYVTKIIENESDMVVDLLD